MKVARMKWLSGWLTRRRLAPELAPHRIGSGGAFVGRIDECGAGVVRGWICEARRPERPVRLEVLVDGQKAADAVANEYREDLARIQGGAGLHGFRVVLPPLDGVTLREIAVRVAGRPRLAMRAVALGADARSVEARLQHIFDHVTATHERVMERLDRLAASGALQPHAGAAPHEAVLMAQAPRSAIAGVGRFARDELPDAVEEEIMAARLRQALLKARSRA